MSREPTRAEVAKRLKLPVNKVSDIDMWIQKKSSLDAPVGPGGDSQLGDFIEGRGYASATTRTEKLLNQERVSYLLDSLTNREKVVLNSRFGIIDGKPHTLAEVSEELKVSRERVRQIEKEALKKLKKYAEEEQNKKL